jgi:hypothetical protein
VRAFAIRVRNNLASYDGKILIHDNRAELEFLLPAAEIVEVVGLAAETMPLKEHPSCAMLRWPLQKQDFR